MRKNSAHAVVAAAVNASVASGALASVVASSELSVNKDVVLSGFKCTCCATRFGAVAGTTPFCITCGSEDVEDMADSDDVVAALGGHAHCVQCGADLPYVVPGTEEQGVDLPTVDPLGADDVAAGVDDQNNGVDTTVPEQSIEDTNTATEDNGPVDSADNNTVVSDLTDDDYVDVDLDDNAGEDAEDDFDVVQTSTDSCMAFVNGMPVAKATRDKVGAAFASVAWVRSIKHVASEQGRRAALASFKFEPLVIKVALKPVAVARIDKMLADKTNEVTASAKDLREDWSQCVAIALAGINKGFWRQTENALKAGFYEELSASGVSKPAQLVDKVFASHGRSFLQTVVSKAEELRGLSLSTRNELAQQVEASNYMAAADDEEDDTESMDVTARLSGQGMRTKSVASVISTVTPLKSTLAGRKLF